MHDPGTLKANLMDARTKSAAEKLSFKETMRTRRCLVPAGGFYKWQRQGSKRQPFYVTTVDGPLLAFAGVYEVWEGEGEPLVSCMVLTTTPNDLLAAMHDRMPVVLWPEGYERWLDQGTTDTEALRDLLKPYEGRMNAQVVSTRVNSPRQDGPELLRAA